MDCSDVKRRRAIPRERKVAAAVRRVPSSRPRRRDLRESRGEPTRLLNNAALLGNYDDLSTH